VKIGLVRHFKVKRGYPEKRFLSQKELFQWLEEYEASDIEDNHTDMSNFGWKRCYTSDLPRAEKTAGKIFQGEITSTKELREIPLSPLFKRNIILPTCVWPILVRIAWLADKKSQIESKAAVRKRVDNILNQILSQEEDVLIVSHGALMIYLRKALIKRGFKGPRFATPENGKVYIFEKQ